MLSVRQRLLALMLVVVGGFTWWLQQRIQVEPPRAPPAPRRPDYTVQDFTATMMNKQGVPDRRLSAPILRHYPDDGSSELDDPVLTLFRADGPPWVIRSRSGWVSAEGEKVVLRGDVGIDRAGTANLRPIQLRTAELRVRPRQDYAETDTPVRITSEGDWVTSTAGAQAWLGKALRVKLLGRSHAKVAAATFHGSDEPKGDKP
jgi:lipopolysaccharide export system protein LptC